MTYTESRDLLLGLGVGAVAVGCGLLLAWAVARPSNR